MRGASSLALAAAVLAATGCRFGEKSEKEDRPLPIGVASRSDFSITVEEVGVAQARSSVPIRAPFHGKVLRLVAAGTSVEAGEPVLWLDAQEKQRDLDRLVADESGARSEYEKQMARIALQARQRQLDLDQSLAKLEFERGKRASREAAAEDARRLEAAGLISTSALDRALDEMRSAQLAATRAEIAHARKVAQVESQERQVAVARVEAQRRLADVEARKTEVLREVESAVVRAPAAGVVFLPKVSVRGATEPRQVRVGDQVGRWTGALMEIPDPGTLEIRSQVDESLIARVTPGLHASVRATAVEGLVLEARVRAVGALAIARSKSEGAGFAERGSEENQQVVFPVMLELVDPDARLQPGMTVAVSYVLETLPAVVSVPEDAVFGTAATPLVFVVEAGGWSERPVSLGPASAGRVVVTDGLSGGEAIYLGDPRRGSASRGISPHGPA